MADWSTYAEAPSAAPPLGHVVRAPERSKRAHTAVRRNKTAADSLAMHAVLRAQVNIVPVTRVARKAEKSKEELEKMRLRNRREKFTHYEVRALVRERRSPRCALC